MGGAERAAGEAREARAQLLRAGREGLALGGGGGVCWRCPALARTEKLLRLLAAALASVKGLTALSSRAIVD